jgi:hypothetical protein
MIPSRPLMEGERHQFYAACVQWPYSDLLTIRSKALRAASDRHEGMTESGTRSAKHVAYNERCNLSWSGAAAQ